MYMSYQRSDVATTKSYCLCLNLRFSYCMHMCTSRYTCLSISRVKTRNQWLHIVARTLCGSMWGAHTEHGAAMGEEKPAASTVADTLPASESGGQGEVIAVSSPPLALQ